MGGNLASVGSETENAAIFAEYRARDFWIGLNKLAGAGWQWSDGSPTTFTKWARYGSYRCCAADPFRA